MERRSADGLPYYAPEVPLLYKALTADRRPSNDADFAAALSGLAPRHPWLAPLGVERDT